MKIKEKPEKLIEEGGISSFIDMNTDFMRFSVDEPVFQIKCPNCGGAVHMQGKCETCSSCGWSSCGI